MAWNYRLPDSGGTVTAPHRVMNNPGAPARQRKTEEIAFDRWIPFLSEFTRENTGAHARLEIVGADSDIGYQVETEDRPFGGVSADIRDRERTVWIVFGATAENRITHGVQNAAAIRALAATGTSGPVLEVEAADGTKTILELNRADAYSLPPPAARDTPGLHG